MTQINSLIKAFKEHGDDHILDKFCDASIIEGIKAQESLPNYLLTYTDKYGCGVYYNWVLTVPHSNGILFFVLKNGYSDEAAVIINLKSDKTFEVLEDARQKRA